MIKTRCIYCKGFAKLVKCVMQVKRGLKKVNLPQHYYECKDCGRTFRTQNQIMQTTHIDKGFTPNNANKY